jgi:hypothetical protein
VADETVLAIMAIGGTLAGLITGVAIGLGLLARRYRG